MIKEPTAKHGDLSSIYMVENQPPQTNLWPPYAIVLSPFLPLPLPPPISHTHIRINVKWFRFLTVFGNVYIIKPKP